MCPSALLAQSLDKDFTRTGQRQTTISSWHVFGTTAPLQEWSRLVEIIVSGFGVIVSSSGFFEDAFYPIVPKNPDVPHQGQGVLPPQGRIFPAQVVRRLANSHMAAAICYKQTQSSGISPVCRAAGCWLPG